MQLIPSRIIPNGVIIKKKSKDDFIHISKEEARELLKHRVIHNYGKGYFAIRGEYKNGFDKLKDALKTKKLLF